MEVILLEHVSKLGNIGEVVKVRNGFARNFLLPQNKALRATKDNVARFEAQKAEIEARNKQKRDAASGVSGKVEGQEVIIIRQASDDGRLYGSVSTRDISAALNEKVGGASIERNQIHVAATIKTTGIYKVDVELHPEVVVGITVNVARTESEARDALKAGEKKAAKQDEPEAAQETEAETAVLEATDEAA